jgi:glutathione synthase
MWYYDVGSLAWDSLGDGPARVAWAAPVTVQRPTEKGESHYTLGASRRWIWPKTSMWC